MAFDNYVDLQAEITNYLARPDLASEIPSFIALAEAKFNRGIRSKDMETRATTTVDINSTEPEFISLPSDYHSMRRVRISSVSGKPRLSYLASEMMDERRYTRQDATGQPQWFTVIGSEMELLPTPDDTYTIEMTYRKLIPSLAANSTNWLLSDHPDAYLYGALMEAEPYMKNDPRIATWAQMLNQVVQDINEASDRAAFNSGPLRIQIGGMVNP